MFPLEGAPPLPLVQDVSGLLSFLLSSLDDLAEDVVKITLLCLSGWVLVHVLTRLSVPAGRGGGLKPLVVTVLLLLYPTIDDISDNAGDRMHGVQNLLRTSLAGYPKKKAQRYDDGPYNASFLVRVVDDLVEDTFKFGCVGSHVMIGNMLRTAVLAGDGDDAAQFSGTWRFARAVTGAIVGVGAPAKAYEACDQYADALGDWAQQRLSSITQYK
jgi:hypothetical protein